MNKRPNVIFVFSDQHRACDTGYAGNTQVRTPCLDRLRRESCEIRYAVSGMPVCCAYRASLMTGQYPLHSGIFLNDLYLDTDGAYLGETFRDNGYATAYIGKWDIDGHGRSAFIPPERRRGFDYWRVNECCHDYNHSHYYGDTPEKKYWEGYDVFAETDCAADYVRQADRNRPFFLMLSYGPPHNPYETAPQKYKDLYPPEKICPRVNVPEDCREAAQKDLSGYYAHISAIDTAVGRLADAVREAGIEEDTIFIYTSDHGDMLYSHGLTRKQKPWDESCRVPFLLRYPAMTGRKASVSEKILSAVDIMPTLLGLCGLSVPASVDGEDCSPYLRGERPAPEEDAALLSCVHPCGEYAAQGRPYRGLRTRRYTYVADLNGPWLLYDNEKDPYQEENLAENPDDADLRQELDAKLRRRLAACGDAFLPGWEYIRQFGYQVDATGTVPYTD